MSDTNDTTKLLGLDGEELTDEQMERGLERLLSDVLTTDAPREGAEGEGERVQDDIMEAGDFQVGVAMLHAIGGIEMPEVTKANYPAATFDADGNMVALVLDILYLCGECKDAHQTTFAFPIVGQSGDYFRRVADDIEAALAS